VKSKVEIYLHTTFR